MNRRLRFAALLPLLLLAPRAFAEDPPVPAPVPQDAPKEAPKDAPRDIPTDVPKAAPRTPLPPEPKDAVKKAIQAILKHWFENEPKIPVKGKTEADCKSARALAGSDLETEILKSPGCLRLASWWKARLEETQPSENKPAGAINPKVEFVYGEGTGRKTYTFAVSVPKSYRGNGTDLLPVIITVIDKGADAKKVLPDLYGKLLDTHIVVAAFENNIPNPGTMTVQIFYAFLNYHCDRDRVTLDGIGKGARFVEPLATEDYSALQWNGVVIRSPTAVQPLEKNLGLFPVGVVDPGVPAGQSANDAAQSHVKAGAPGALLPAGDAAKVQAFVAGLPPRKVGDQKNGYEMYFKSLGRMPKWGYWFLLKQSVDGGKDLPVRVAISRNVEYNLVDIDASNLAEGVLLLNDDVLDLEQPVAVRVNGILVAREKVTRFARETFAWDGGYATFHYGSRNYFIVAALPFVVPEGDARIPKADRDAAAAAEKKAAEDKKKSEDADAAAKEAERKAAEDAKNPKPEPGPGENPPVPAPVPVPAPGPGENPPVPAPVPGPAVDDGTKPFFSLEAAKAANRNRPLLVVFQGDGKNPIQVALEVAFMNEDVKKALLPVDLLNLSPAEAGDAGKPTRDLFAEVSGAADSAPPFLALCDLKEKLVVRAKLPLAGAKEGDVQAAVLKLLAGLGQPPASEPPVQKKPTVIPWGEDYEAGRKAALERKVPLIVYFRAISEDKGPALPEGVQAAQAALDGVVLDHPEITLLLSKAVCVRLNVGGPRKDKILAVLATVASNQVAPCLWGVRVEKSDKDEPLNTNGGLLDPVNKTKEMIAAVLVKLLGEWGLGDGKPATAAADPKPGEPNPGGQKPGEPKTEEKKPADPKPEEKKPEEKKPDPPKPADPK